MTFDCKTLPPVTQLQFLTYYDTVIELEAYTKRIETKLMIETNAPYCMRWVITYQARLNFASRSSNQLGECIT